MAQAFYGRAAALDEALASGSDNGALADMLERNVYGTVTAPAGAPAALAAYVRAQDGHLSGIDPVGVQRGAFHFLPVGDDGGRPVQSVVRAGAPTRETGTVR